LAGVLRFDMRVLYTSDLLGVHDYRFLELLVRNGHEAMLVTYTNHIDRFDYPIFGYDVRALQRLDIVHRRPLSRNPCLNPILVAPHFKRAVARFKPDIVHTGWLQTSGFVAALAGCHPLVVMPIGSDALLDPFRSVTRRWITKYVVKRADVITTNSEFMRRAVLDVTGCPPEKVRTIYWGIDMNRFNDRYDKRALKKKRGWEKKLVLVHNRTFRGVYGHKYLFRAVKELVKELPHLLLVLGAGGPREKELRVLADKLDINDYLFWPGYVSTEEFGELLRCGDIYVNPSLSDASSASLQEAMACGLPVVATGGAGNAEWIVDGVNGFLVPPRNAHALAEKILLLAKDADLRGKMARKNAEDAARRADREKNFREIEKLYDELVGRRRSRTSVTLEHG